MFYNDEFEDLEDDYSDSSDADIDYPDFDEVECHGEQCDEDECFINDVTHCSHYGEGIQCCGCGKSRDEY